MTCQGTYEKHLQGICRDDSSIYWSFTTQLVKTDRRGQVLTMVSVADHHGDLCYLDGKVYVAVNLGKFNDANGMANSWVYVYEADSLREIARHEIQQVYHGAGGIASRDGHFFVVGGLPAGIEENYVYEFDAKFQFLKRHIVPSGQTLLGIQTATWAENRWWLGCYGNPKILLVADAEFNLLGRYEFDCSLGLVGLGDGRLLAASGQCRPARNCTGSLTLAVPDEQSGLKYVTDSN
ncbi:MAG: hypothetical protein KF752_05575 [Pirellulaceae bacterium]|nr:hypothetical protein [Pirellulaceae bacterium]